MDKKKGYTLDHPTRSKDKEVYIGGAYDNGTYVSDDSRQGQGDRYPKSNTGSSVEDPQFSTFRPSSETGDNKNSNTSSSKRTCIVITVLIVALIVVIAAAGAVIAVILLRDTDDSLSEPKTMERIVQKTVKGEATINTKNWTDTYEDKDSVEYKTLELEFIDMVDAKLLESSLAYKYNRTIVTNMREGSFIIEFESLFITTLKIMIADGESLDRTTQRPTDGRGDDPDFNLHVDVDRFQKLIKEISQIDDAIVSDYDECMSNPCKNGGTCYDGVNKFTCTCTASYTGVTCEDDQENCQSNPCYNNGTCIDGINDFMCKCLPGYTGKDCSEDIDDCEGKFCGHGNCVDEVNSYSCLCEDGWMGQYCDEDYDECMSDPCRNGGTCYEVVNKFTCNCNAGYIGVTCEHDEEICQCNPCHNGGICQDGINGFTCKCLPGYTGKDCSEDIDDCEDKLCGHGNCVDEVNSYSCLCEDGWMGQYCDEDFNECRSENPCKNWATCQNIIGSYLCICQPGWAGLNCDININECRFSQSPCKNGGTCVDRLGNYTCVCPDDWGGHRCEIDKTVTTKTKDTSTTSSTVTTAKPTYKTTMTTTKPTYKTTTQDCHTADKFVYQIDGVILLPYDNNLNDYDSPQSKELGDRLIGSLRNATNLYGLTVCDLYLKGFFKTEEGNHVPSEMPAILPTLLFVYPVDQSSIPSPLNTDKKTGFTVALILFSSIREQDVIYLFSLFMSDQFIFTSMIDFQSSETSTYPTTATTSYPKGTCNQNTSFVTYSFNMTYVEVFTEELFNPASEAFRNLNQTLSGLFVESVRNESDDQWVCFISLIKCVPTYFDYPNRNDLFISAEVLVSVPANTITVHETAYYFSQAALRSGILFLISFKVYSNRPITPVIPSTSTSTTTTSTITTAQQSNNKTVTTNTRGASTTSSTMTTAKPTYKTTTQDCHTADKFVYQIDGVILLPYDNNLNEYDSPQSKELGDRLIGSLRNATNLYGLTVCDLYLKGFYPVDQSAIPSPLNTDKKTGFTVALILFSSIREQDVIYLFSLFMSDQFIFTSMIDFQSSETSTYSTTATTSYPRGTCNQNTSFVTYSFNMTYVEVFTEELFNPASEAFRNLNQTLSGLFLESVRNESDDQWVCFISLIKCVPTYFDEPTRNDLFISAEVLVSVPANTINIHETAYYFSQAALRSGILFLISFKVYSNRPITPVIPSTTTTTTTTTQQRTVPVNNCRDNEYQCIDGTKCIPASYVCDGWKDCQDREDERGCDCPESYCKLDGDCISEDVLCDGVFDCDDKTDEQGCPVVCTPEQFTCRLINECVDISLKCDNKKDCKDGTDEWFDCSPSSTSSPPPREYEIRLMNEGIDTTSQLYGRVEIRLVVDGKPASEFGTICDDSWDKREATVLCRYFGASDPFNSFAYSQALFGEGIGPIWLRNFHCNGDEEKLEDCKSSDWGQTHCSHLQDASVSCGVDRHATTTTTSTLSTSDTTQPLTTTPSIRGSDIRLVGGHNCLEGRIEVLYDGEWGTVCNNGFGNIEARIVCKAVGFSTFETFESSLDYGNSTGPILLSYLNCRGYEHSLSECKHLGWGVHRCSHDEDQGIRCFGDPDIDCRTEPDVPDVNCTFNRGRCAYHTEVLSGNVNWWWTISSAFDISDSTNSTSSTSGRVMVYQNIMGSEGDKARMTSPLFSPTSTEMKVEFYYLLREPSYNDLTFSLNESNDIKEDGEDGGRVKKRADHEDNEALETDITWNSLYVRRDQENQWLYECVQLTDLNQASTYSLAFTAKRGPNPYPFVALDEILVAEGRCSESILDGMCDFDKPRSCGMTVDCSNCDRKKPSFSWIWQSNVTNTGVRMAHGRFMMVNFTFGSEGDEAVMSFSVPSLHNRPSFNFKYNAVRQYKGNLEILLYVKGTFHSVISTISKNSKSWSKKCIQFPTDIDSDEPATIAFKVVHGGGSNDYIAVDDVDLTAEHCPNPVSTCDEEAPQCGWVTNSNRVPFQWKYFKEGQVGSSAANLRLVEGPDPSKGHVEILHNDIWGRVCDDGFGTAEATVVCRMLGYPTETVEYLEESPYGYTYGVPIWLDELSCTGDEESLEDCVHNDWGINNCLVSEHVAVHCFGTPSGASEIEKNVFMLSDQSDANINSWASLSSSDITHTGGEYRFVFDMFKAGFELIQVWYQIQNKTHILDKIFDPTDSKVRYCVDFADITGEITVGLTAFKTSVYNVKTSVANFSLEQGHCKESPIKRNFTFESDYMFYGYEVSMDENVCEQSYKWGRVQAKYSYGIDIDKTLGDETGHFMYVNILYADAEYTSDFALKQITAEESRGLCSLKFFYFVNGVTRQRYLELVVNTKAINLYGIPKVHTWLPGCVALVDICGEDPGSLVIGFQAVHVEAGIDDIVLTTDSCPETQSSSVECDFENGTACGYYFDPKFWSQDRHLLVVSSDPGNYLVSPLFDTLVDSCVEIAFSSTTSHTIRLIIINLDGDTVATTEFLQVPSSLSREIQQDITAGSNLRLYFEAYYLNDFVFDRLAVKSIKLRDGNCVKPGLSCDFAADIECDGRCISPDMICDGIRHCTDSADERCDCDETTFNCTLNNECVAPALQCDGFKDCTDGSDENNCEPSVGCSFNRSSNFDCGYFLYLAQPGSGGTGLRMLGLISYITSPDITINDNSCLAITAAYIGTKLNIRVASFDGEMYTVLYQGPWQFVEMTIQVNVSAGYYKGFTIETRAEKVFDRQIVLIKEISLTDNVCEEIPTSSTTTSTSVQETTWSNDISTTKDITESSTIQTSLPNERTTSKPKPLPDTFPVVSLVEPDPVALGDHVILSCYVRHNVEYELILSWLVGDTEIFRNNELMSDKDYGRKYSVDMTYDNTGTNYDLTIDDVSNDDFNKEFTCVADVVGYWPSNVLNASTKIEKIDDGCFALGDSDIEKFCETIGYGKVTTPSISGFQTMDDIRKAFGYLQYHLELVKHNFNETDQCYYPLLELICGIHTSKCDSGKVVSPICREHCEEIADTCISNDFPYVYNHEILANYGCKFLPSQGDVSDCTEIWLDCGANIVLGKDDSSSSMRLRSNNYPNKSPDVSPCIYHITTSAAYFSLTLSIEELVLAEDCNASYLMINEDRLCSDNASQFTLTSDLTSVKLSLVSLSADAPAGFLISFAQEYPASVCDVFEVDFNINTYRNVTNSGSSCTEWLFMSDEKGYSISLNFSELRDCLDLLDEDSELIQEICDPEPEIDLNRRKYVKVKSKAANNVFKVRFTLVPTRDDHDFSITSVELREGHSHNEGKVFITRSDGRSGYLCGYINFGASNVICRMAGFGSPSLHYQTRFGSTDDINTKDIIMYELECDGQEESIMKCKRQEWMDVCQGDLCSCYDKDDFRGVRCPLKTAQCTFVGYDCGYEYNNSLVKHFRSQKFGYGLHMTGSSNSVTEIRSPPFTYTSDSVVTFGYSFEGVPGENLALALTAINESGSEDLQIWQKPHYSLDGLFIACVGLPENLVGQVVQMIFTMNMRQASVSNNEHTIGLHNLTIRADRCPEEFPKNKCTFTNINICQKLLSNICTNDSFGASVWNIKDNRLEGNSAYAIQDEDYSVTFTSSTLDTGSNLRFKYDLNGVGVNGNDLNFRVDFKAGPNDVKTIYSDIDFKQKKEICLHLPTNVDGRFQVDFVLRKSSSEGLISLDDIELSEDLCPHPISCDFEERRMCDYDIDNHGALSWYWVSVNDDHTFGGQSIGHVVRIDSARILPAVFSTPVAQLRSSDTKYKCLAFFLKSHYYTERAHRLDVSVFYPNTNETFTREIAVRIPFVWQEINLKVDPDKVEAQFSFKATYLHGLPLINSLVVDDIELRATQCKDGLQDLEECDFSNPVLCAFEINCTINSGYSWRIYSAETNRYITSPGINISPSINITDGPCMFLDSSFGAKGHGSYLWFKVDLNDIKDAHYTFSYYMSGDGTGMLRTFYSLADTNTYSDVSVVDFKVSGIWLQSECYELPDYFHGEIFFQGIRGDSAVSDIAIDNVKITRRSCEVPSVACGFNENTCGYKPVNSVWTLEDGYILTKRQGALTLPIHTINDQEHVCIAFAFESDNTNALIIETAIGSEHTNYTYTVYSDGKQRGQLDYRPEMDEVKFVVPGDYLMKIDHVTTTSGQCEELNCENEEFVCPLQCIPAELKCDRKIDCDQGQDEEDCGFGIACKFDSSNDCGYAAMSGSKTKWLVKESHSFILNGTEMTVNGGMLYTNLKGQPLSSSSSARSTWERVRGPSCIRFKYLGTVPFLEVTITDKDSGKQTTWNDTMADMTPSIWRIGQLEIEKEMISDTGAWIMLNFTASLLFTDHTVKIDEDPFIAIDNIELLDGSCKNQSPPSCPDNAPLHCDGYSHCYTTELHCDRKTYCPTGSDESFNTCASEFKIECDFERDTLCGYEITSNRFKKWKRVRGNWYQIPPFDHTKQDESGHFLLFVNWDNNHVRYDITTAISPAQIFPENGCVTFWYYLNSTAVQPTGLSAQIMVSLNYVDTAKTEFVWYDLVNRPIDGWIFGNFEVPENQKLSVNFTAVTSETFLAYPGVVGLDDVSFTTGKCPVSQECSNRMFSCKESGTCIPKTFICDGKYDCRDQSDEHNCDDRPNGTFQLVGGDGTYGQLQYYLGGSWRQVCFPPDSSRADDFSYIASQRVCEQLGFYGKSEAFEYKLMHTTTKPVSLTCDDEKCSHTLCSVSYTATFAGIKCSNSACFSGTKLCPGTADVCRPTRHFCNGNPDCPYNTDEIECCCHEGDEYCTRTPDESKNKVCVTCKEKGMFECQSHQCISKDKVCDGNKDCVDGTDEYRCIDVKEDEVTVHYNSEMIPVCYNNIGRHEAEALCSSSGRGLLVNRGIQRGYTEVDGVMLIKSNLAKTILPGLDFGQRRYCYPLILKCKLPVCGTSSIVDNFISPLIPHGNEAVLGARPYHGSLRKNNKLHCGCTVIGGQWVLTAAHCVEYSVAYAYKVILGSIESDKVGEHGQQFSVIDIVSHPQYNADDVTKGYDVALLKLAHAPNFDNYTRPACLGTKTSWQYILDLGDKAECYITGFGANELYLARDDNSDKVLDESRVGIIDRKTCQEKYTETGSGNVSHDGICVENRTPYQAACYGDSGGPLVCRNEIGRWELFGDLSYGSYDCTYDTPSVYFAVTSQREWIKSVTGLQFPDDYGPVYDSDNAP